MHFSLWDWRGFGRCAECRHAEVVGKAATVKPTLTGERARSWIVDYSAARARAIEWLGDRYLLARPINVKEHPSRKAPGAATTAVRLALAAASPERRRL